MPRPSRNIGSEIHALGRRLTGIDHVIELSDDEDGPPQKTVGVKLRGLPGDPPAPSGTIGSSKGDSPIIDLTHSDSEDYCPPKPASRQKRAPRQTLEVIEISTDEDEPIVASPLKPMSKGKQRLGPRLSFKDVLDELYKDEDVYVARGHQLSELLEHPSRPTEHEILNDGLPVVSDTSRDEALAEQLEHENKMVAATAQPAVKITVGAILLLINDY